MPQKQLLGYFFGGNLNPGDTITINGTVYTAVASGAVAYQFNVGATAGATSRNFMTAFNSNKPVSGGFDNAVYTNYSQIKLSASTTGPAGNSYTLAKFRYIPIY